jgi:basic amino acid/polyamine antiporter, APA family
MSEFAQIRYPRARKIKTTPRLAFSRACCVESLKRIRTALSGGLFPVRILGELVSIGTLAAFVTVCLGVLVLRQTQPELHRPFRVPAPCLVCTCGALICLAMMVCLGGSTWIRLIVWTAAGLLVYLGYGRKHSQARAALNSSVQK